MIAIDFDGVLHKYTGWNSGRLDEPIAGAKEFVEEILRQGLEMAVFTTRDSNDVKLWLNKYGFPPLFITDQKLGMFHVFLDDRARCFDGKFGNVKELVEELKNFKLYWKKTSQSEM